MTQLPPIYCCRRKLHPTVNEEYGTIRYFCHRCRTTVKMKAETVDAVARLVAEEPLLEGHMDLPVFSLMLARYRTELGDRVKR